MTRHFQISAMVLFTLFAGAHTYCQAEWFQKRDACCQPCLPCPPPKPCPPPPPSQPCTKWSEKTVVNYKPEWREREVICTVNRVCTREEIVPTKRIVVVPEWKTVNQVMMEYKRVPRQIEKVITICKTVPTKICDPCTGCTHCVDKQETTLKKVKCTVYDIVPCQKIIQTRVCEMKTVEKICQTRKLVPVTVPVKITRKEKYCVMVPCEMKIRVPIGQECPCK